MDGACAQALNHTSKWDSTAPLPSDILPHLFTNQQVQLTSKLRSTSSTTHRQAKVDIKHNSQAS